MPGWLWVVIIVAAVVVVLGLLLTISSSRRRKRSHALRERFGSEYDRKVHENGRRRAESELADVAETHDQLDLRPVNTASRDRYLARWREVQAQFVDQPGHAIDSADVLVVDLMRERGYEADDFDRGAELVGIDHPDVVQHYRAAHDTKVRTRTGLVSTEDARVAMLQYRALFEALLDDGGFSQPGGPSTARPAGQPSQRPAQPMS